MRTCRDATHPTAPVDRRLPMMSLKASLRDAEVRQLCETWIWLTRVFPYHPISDRLSEFVYSALTAVPKILSHSTHSRTIFENAQDSNEAAVLLHF